MQGPGGVRAGLFPGKVIVADLFTTTPFENKVLSLELPGFAIREVLEFSVHEATNLHVMQVSGIKVVYDMSRKPYDRIIDLKVLCQKCQIPRYEDIDAMKYYRVAMGDYLAFGGDDFTMIPKNARNHIEGPLDIDALTNYVEKHSPINVPGVLGRIQFV